MTTGSIFPPVAVTGLGLITGLGLDLESSWQGLIEGRSVTRRFTAFDPEGLACPFGVELPDGAADFFAARISRRRLNQMTTGTKIGVATARMALEDSGIDLDRQDKNRIGVVIGSTGTGYVENSGADSMRILKNMSNSPASWISLQWKLHGPSFVIGTACSSGAYALAAAYGLIVSDQCDAVLCGGIDSSLNYRDVEGFCNIMALADGGMDIKTASRPFDKTRKGFVIGEGGGMLLAESLHNAVRRGARIYAFMHYPGLYSEAYNILSPEPEGKSMARCMTLALQHARLKPEQIDSINAHGTSTQLNDLYECRAIRRVFGPHACKLAVSSTKSMTGHCLAGGAGVEAVICCKALSEQIVPPTINLHEPDPELDLDFVTEGARRMNLRHVMSNSFAFGGHCGVNIFSRPDGAGL